jgi:O-antigen/teichoic acid export membrane protein
MIMDIKKKAITGVKWTAVSTIVNYGFQLLLIVVLARFLSPSDFGLMAIITVVIEFSVYFLDMGISNAIIHKQEISNVQLSTIYWLNIFTGIAVFIIVALLAPVIAAFYHEELLNHLILIVSSLFIILPFGQQYKSLFQKVLNFDILSKIEISARSAAFLISLYLAFKGAGIYALVGMVLTNNLISTVLLVVLGKKLYVPQFVFRIKEIKSFLWFGYFQLGERTLNYFAGQFDALFIGKFLGSSPLGIYSMGKGLTQRPAQIILPVVTKVAFPYMARLQNDNEPLKKAYLNTLQHLCSVNFPIYAAMAILAEPIVMLMFGPKWRDAIPIVRILAIFNIFASGYSPVGSLLLAKGRTDLGFYWNLANALITPCCIYIGSFWGLQGIAWAYVVMYFAMLIPFYNILIKNLLVIHWWEYHKALVVPLSITISACIIPLFFSLVITDLIIRTILVICSGLTVYYFLTAQYNNGFLKAVKQFSQ